MPKITPHTLLRDCSKVSSDKAIAWRENLALRMEAENILYLSAYTIKIRSKTSPEPMAVTAYHRENGTVLVWRVKHQLIVPGAMRVRYWNCTAKLPWTGADYYPFAAVTGGCTEVH